ncbi:MAG TPA: response regulator [Candidatus Cloacimonadota bacterium]|nr:response regulator [Candidatus Cloacimonadales bacterium]HPY95639.1 response regulator [Candidatus Cloacimonadota bacterium]HQB40869.1 response regulator [Candidatus Cloacimonadota bacterium]
MSINQKTILIVDDDELLGELMVQIIQEMGYNTAFTKNGNETLYWLKNNQPSLILFDYSLPDMNAALLINLIDGENGIPPFIIFTGMGDEFIAVDMMKRGARDYLVKDAAFLSNLIIVINRIMRDIENEDKLKEMEKHLLCKETFYKAIINSVPNMVFFVDAEDKVQLINKYALILFNVKEADWLGKNINQIKEEYPQYSTFFEIIEDKQEHTITYNYILKDNDAIELSIIKIPVYDDQGEYLGLHCMTSKRDFNMKNIKK